MKNTLLRMVPILILTWSLSADAATTARDISLPQVTLRQGVTVDLTVTVWEKNHCFGQTIFAVPSVLHTAATFTPFAQALLDEPGVCRAALLDLPSHGKSGIPSGATYGDLTFDDYVSAVIGALDGLRARWIFPTTIVGRGMGGLLIQLAQQRLIDDGTSLAQRYGTFAALFLGTDLGLPLPEAFEDSGTAGGVVATFTASDPVLGNVFAVPPAVWVSVWYSDHLGQPVPAALSADEVVARGYVAAEALRAAQELVGQAPLQRPFVRPGLFTLGRGTILVSAAMAEDVYTTPDEERAAYVYLTGDAHLLGFVDVTGPNAVRDIDTLDPQSLLSQLRSSLLDNF